LKRLTILLIVILMISAAFAADIQANFDPMQQSSFSTLPPPADLEKQIDPDEYIIGVGDQFLVEKIQDKTLYTLPVLPTGIISIPGVAKINIGGKTLTEALEIISEVAGPYSNVSLYDIKNIRIPVSGAINNPGLFTISAAMRLSDLLKQLPLSSTAKDYAIEIKSEDKTDIVNIYEFFIHGDLSHNPYLHAGESVFIPFADIKTECVEVFGPVLFKGSYEFGPEDAISATYVSTISDKGLRPFIPGESLQNFINRKVQISDAVNYDNIMIIRDNEQIYIPLTEMDSFILQARDKIEFITLSEVMVSGHVNKPGTYRFIPGHTVMDYISMAGGVNYKGSENSAIVVRGDKKIKNPKNVEMKRGDIILVKRSAEDILIGETSILYFISLIASIASTVITAFIAAGSL
jgi:protein involved in polysaccharide export with SLBB domain